MIHKFNRVRDFEHMVNIQPNRAEVKIYATNNSYMQVAMYYFFDGVLRGVRYRPMEDMGAYWFGEGTTLADIKEVCEFMGIFIERNKFQLP